MDIESMNAEQIRKLATTVKGKDKDKTLVEIALSPKTPIDVLEFLSGKSQRVREAVSKNPSLPASLIDKLLSDPAPRVRAALALNPAAAKKASAKLSIDPDPSVRAALARSPYTPVEILRRLLEDPSNRGFVYASLASNQTAPPDVLSQVVRVEHESVVSRHRGGPEDELFFADDSFGPLASAAANPRTPEESLRILSAYKGNEIEWNLAKNPSTPKDVLEAIARSGSASAKRDLALNPSLPLEVAIMLAELGDELCSANLATKETRPEVLDKLFSSIKSIREAEKVALAASKNPYTPVRWIEEMYNEFSREPKQEVVLYRLAKNPATPDAILRKLESEPSPKVSLTARRAIQARP